MKDKDTVLQYIAAYNACDVAKMLGYFTADCVFENISAGKITVRTQGEAELEALAWKSVAAFSARAQKIITITEGQGRIVAEIDYQAVLRADLSPELKAGSRLALRGVSVFEFSGGKIVRLTDYS